MRAILMYHSIDDSGSPISVDAACFERHVDWLARERDAGRLDVVPLERVAAASGSAIAITFDDAFDNFASEAWPRLAERGLPATVFVVSGHVGGDNRWGGRADPGIPVKPILGWPELARLRAAGAELGCHTRSHPNLEALAPEAAEEELVLAADEIEARTGARPNSFAYPFGRHDDASRRLAERHFERAVTTELAVLPAVPDPHVLPRLDAWYYRAPGRLEAFGGARFRAHLALRVGARRVRAAFRPHGGG